MWFTIILASTVVGLFLFYRRRCRQMIVFKEMGLPGPEPHWLLGNFAAFRKKILPEVFAEWSQKYGKTFGYYEGPTPVICTQDLDFLQQVFIKQFSKFHSRKDVPLGPDPDKAKNMQMFMARGQRWKRLRTIINPTFSMAKLRQMAPVMNNSLTRLIEKLTKACAAGEPFNIYPYYQGLTLEVIGECACGFHTDSQSNDDNKFLQHARDVFNRQDPMNISKIMLLALIFPELKRILWQLRLAMAYFTSTPPFAALGNLMKQIIEERREERRCSNGKEHFVDLLHLMLEAENAQFDNLATDEALTMQDERGQEVSNDITPKVKPEHGGGKSSLKAMTKNEAVSQSILFILAGYETTSTALAYATYLLAKYPDVQEKLYQEMQQHLPCDTEPSYEDVQNIEYLDMVLRETLRIYPIGALIINRKCMEECTVHGYKIKPGIAVQVNLMSVHRDPDLWPNPELFKPERFSSVNQQGHHPLAWIPFGIGPRNCVGLRFALMEAKIALCRILSDFRFEFSEKTPDPLPLRQSATITPKEGVVIKLSCRKDSL